MIYKKVCSIILIGMVLAFPTACSKSTATSQNESSQTKEVRVQDTKFESVNNISELSGTLQPIDETTVSFEVSGTVNSVNVQEGSNVSINDILASIDSKNYELQVAQAQSGVDNAAATVSKTEKGARAQEIEQSKLRVDEAEKSYNQAVTDYNRNKALFEAGAISQSDYEKYQNAMTTAQNNMENTKQEYSLTAEGATDEEKKQAVAAYDQAKLVKEQADLSLSKTCLRSPMNGIIISKYISQGQLVSQGTQACKVGNIDKLKVTLPVPDYEISSWKVGDKITAKLYDDSMEGTVTNIFAATNESTGSINVEVTIDNPDHKWRAGQVVTCKHEAESGTSIFVPKGSVISNGNASPYVFLLQDDKAVKTDVEIGTLKNNKLEIKSGIKEDEKIVTEGADRLSDGDKVNVLGSDEE
ncbi:efflux RND transporter periplasmic adaptor subunit [Clostridium diolis]|uniref:efflux RND transporter periplasmic adaptor subunit n=1 Tax=Clostridium diolis TaxID=223919 RepID=UPI003AF89FDF